MSTDLISLGTSRQKALKDQVSPYKIALLILIEEHLKSGPLCKKLSSNTSEADAEELQFLTSLLHLMQSPDVDFLTLIVQLQQQLTKTDSVTDLTRRLFALYDGGINSLMNLMQSMREDVLTHIDLISTSICGLFIRRICLAFDRLSFSQVIQLYKKFRVMFAEVKDKWIGLQPDINISDDQMMLAGDMMDTCMYTNPPDQQSTKFVDAGRYSVRQAEYFIAQQTLILGHNEQEALSPCELQSRITDLLLSNPDIAEAHYLSYLNYLRLRDYCATIDSLYHYYDRFHMIADQAAGTNKAKVSDEDITSRCYRYATLGLAATHFRFGHRREALAAVQESIRIAQETNDSVCLQHALGWLQRLGIQIEGGQGFLLEKLISTCGELNLPYLKSLGVQAFARHSALSFIQPSLIFQYLIMSDVLNCQHSLSELVSTGLAQKAALWDMYGRSDMCSLNAQLALNLNTQEAGIYHNAEPECVALCHLAQLHADQGLCDTAHEILRSARSRFPTSCHDARLWMTCEQKIKFMTSLHRCRMSTAEQAISSLAAVDKLEADYCRCLLLAEKGEANSVINAVDAVLEECRHQETSQQHFLQLTIRLLMLKGNAYCSTQNPTLAMKPLLEALSLAKQSHCMLLKALATLHISFVQYCLGLPQLALDHITQVYNIIICHASLFDIARTVYLMVKCRLAVSNRKQTEDRIQVIESSVSKLNEVIRWFKQLETYQRLKDVLYFQSCLYDQLSLPAQRNKTALEFHQLDLQYPTWNVANSCQL